ncbi:interleukin-23 receptor [Eublepharis macularius]|uniref:Leptin receptor n=1 Tax=Eublepharis macularius TaxID=481883 RepID=A0AA97KZ52_EUBMA|nr:interleukin-23 receptor [Eublepharis macularius]
MTYYNTKGSPMREERGKQDKQAKFKHTDKNRIKIVITFPGSGLQADIQCDGHVWIEPAQVILMGQNISINCHSPTELCKKAQLYMHLNFVRVEDRFLSVINKTTIQLQLQDFNSPFSTVVCYASCPQSQHAEVKLVCGTQFCMGYLPDQPADLTCFIQEYSNNLTCTWDPGKDTHLNTRYNVHLKSLQTEENKTFTSSSNLSIIPLAYLQKSQRFYVWVFAENDLGTAHSDPLYVDLEETVIPMTPTITQAETVDYPVFKTIIKWEKRTAFNDTHCEERHKETTSETWHVRELVVDFKRDHYTEYNLDANTKYEFQVRCKLIQPGSFWSTWSEPVTYMTSEAEPSSVLDVWRYLGPKYQNGSQEVTILIKPFLPKESRGQILSYSVFCENQGEIMSLCNTTETKCNIWVPATVTSVYVTAQNSKGSSKPANITVNQQSFNYHDFPPPTDMQIIHHEQKGIYVMWKLPMSIGKTVLWYIVEWTCAGWHSDYQHDILWEKIPSQNTTTYIPGNSYRVVKNGAVVQADDDVGVLLGIGIGVAFLSFFILAFITKKSFRKRFSTVFISVTPKWLLEDYPQVQNSSVIRLLQEKNCSTMHNFNWLSLDYEDAVVTEVEETLVDTECRALDNKRETKKAVCEISLPFVNNSDMTEENGYKPQVCNKASFFQSSSETHSQNLDAKSNLLASPMNILIKDYMSPITSTWSTEGTDENTLLLEKVNLILSNSRSGQSNIFTSTEEPNRPTENQWKLPSSEDNIQEQTLISDEFLSCLRAVNENSTDLMSYFPQSIAK